MNKVIRALILITLLFSCSIIQALPADSLVVKGQVVDTHGNPLPVVIIEQKETNNFVFSSQKGFFRFNLVPKKNMAVTASLVGYQTATIYINATDTLPIRIVLYKTIPTDSVEIKPHREHLTALSIYLDYNYLKPSFSNFSDLLPQQVSQLNRIQHFPGFGFHSYVSNIYMDLGFAFNPTIKNQNQYYRHYCEATYIHLNVGYGFSWFKRRLLLTPYASFDYLGTNDYIAPLDKTLSLEQYLQLGYMDLLFKQYLGSVGVKLDYRLFKIKKRQSFYLETGVAYVTKLHRYPIISSKGTHITSPNKMTIFPITASVSVRYVFFSRRKI